MGKAETEVRQTQQWCPTIRNVVVLEIQGKVEGHMINGLVLRCHTMKPCIKKPDSFCWKGRQILTALEGG